jgi:hypothetical protein
MLSGCHRCVGEEKGGKKRIYPSCKKSVLLRTKENPFIDYIAG